MNMLTAVFAVSLAIVIIIIGMIMINPDTAGHFTIFKDGAYEASNTTKSTMVEISRTNVSSVIDPIEEKKDELIGMIKNSSGSGS